MCRDRDRDSVHQYLVEYEHRRRNREREREKREGGREGGRERESLMNTLLRTRKQGGCRENIVRVSVCVHVAHEYLVENEHRRGNGHVADLQWV